MGPIWVQFWHHALILPIWDPFAHACWVAPVTSRPRGHMQAIEHFDNDKRCIDFITILVLMVSFAVVLMVALIYRGHKSNVFLMPLFTVNGIL